jgi:hypothetical protein
MKGNAGFALPAALACIVLIASLATALAFAAGQETSATRAAVLDQQALLYAERGALATIAAWDAGKCDSMAVGTVILVTPEPHPPLESSVYITRLDSALYLVVGEARVVTFAGATRVRRKVAITVRADRDSLATTRAIPLHPYSWNPIYEM